MPVIVEYPQVVSEAVEYFAGLFDNDCQRRHFAGYLTGLFVANRKTVVGIHDEFARTTDQSCLNKFLTKVDWDVDALNDQRLQWLQEDHATRYRRGGVIALDKVLIDHDGKMIEDVGWFWDQAVAVLHVDHVAGFGQPADQGRGQLRVVQKRYPLAASLTNPATV